MIAGGAQALILGDSVEGGTSSLEYQEAEADGFSASNITVATDAQWEAMTTADFEQYQVIIIGDDGQCNKPGETWSGSVAAQTASTWEPAVMANHGNRIVMMTEPVWAYNYTWPFKTLGPPLIADGIAYAAAVPGATGAYVDLACSYQQSQANTSVPFLNGLSGTASPSFTVEGGNLISSTDKNSVNIIANTSQTAALSDNALDNWYPSTEGVFETFPSDFVPYALVPTGGGVPGTYCGTDVSVGGTACGQPYILVAGKGITTGGPSLSEQGGPAPIAESPTTCQTSLPVNCATGAFWHTFQDAVVPGNGVPLDFTRTYSSLDATMNGPLGYGWTDSYDMTLNLSASQATVTEANGSEVPFLPNGSGGYSAPPRVLARLVANSDGTYTYSRYGDHIQYVFNSSGQLVKQIDRNGYTTTLAYANGQLTSVTDPSGRTLSVSYNGSLISSVSEPGGNTWSYSYDGSGNLSSVTGPENRTWSYTYDSNHLLLTMVDPDNGTTTNTYNSSNQVTKQVDPAGRTTTWSYSGNPGSSAGSTTTITDGAGNETQESYQNMELQSITRGYGTSGAATTSYQYDPETLRVSQVTDPDGNTTQYTYDAHGNLLTETDPLNRETQYGGYNSFDEPGSMTDPSGTKTTYTYDSDGNLLTKSTPDTQTGKTQTWQFAYTDLALPGDVTQITDPDSNVTKLGYDSQGDETSTTDPAGNETTYSYDSLGQRTSSVSPAGNTSGANPSEYTTTYSYDVPFELTKVVDPLGNPRSYAYNGDGALTSVTDAKQETTSYELNADDELTKTTNPDGSTTKTSYNGDGTINTQTDGNGNLISYGYDSLGRVTSKTDGLNQATSYDYNGNSDLTSVQDAAGRTTTYGYNANNEPTSISYSDGTTPNVSFGYNALGERTSMSDGTGSSSYTYDSLGRLTATTSGTGDSVSYGYDLAGNNTSITYPKGKTVTRGFDTDNQLTSVTDWQGNATTFGYDPNSNLQTITYPSGTNNVDTLSYDDANQLTGIQMNQGTTVLASIDYTINPVGLTTNQTQTGLPGAGSTDYSYTSTGQLQSAGSNNYSYDNAGNITQLDGQNGYQYNARNELTSSPTASYAYNQLGGRTSSTPSGGAGATDYAYNQAGVLTSVTPATGSSSSYSYDGTGELATETSGSTTNTYAWNQTSADPALLTDGHTNYIYGADGAPIEQIASDGSINYLHHDQIGSTRLITDSTGNAAATITYSPYGQITGTTGTATTNLGYAGQYTDPATGLQYDQARYYDPQTGQFLSQDPLELLSGQAYSYAGDDPTNLVDPSGMLFGIPGTPSLSSIAGAAGNALAGAAAGLTFGYSTQLLNDIGINPNVCSGFYTAGQFAGFFVPGLDGLDALDAAGEGSGLLSRIWTRLADERGSLGGPPGEIAFGHGARHLAGTGLAQRDVEAAIERDVRQTTAGGTVAGSFGGRLTLDGRTIEYRGHGLAGGGINIGTYYPVP